jgi:hypothetical protein
LFGSDQYKRKLDERNKSLAKKHITHLLESFFLRHYKVEI